MVHLPPGSLQEKKSTIQNSHAFSKLLTEPQASEILAVPAKTLQQWRFRGTGPAFMRFGGGHHGMIRYSLDAIHEYISARTLQHSGQALSSDQEG